MDGCGKTTQISLLADFLRKKSYAVETTREPGGTLPGELIRELVLSPKHQGILPLTETLLYLADRAQHVEQKIIPALKTGRIIISERFTDSTMVYQGFGRGVNRSLLNQLNALVTQGLNPHITFLLDIPPETARARLNLRKQLPTAGIHLDRLEQEGLTFYRRVREGYLVLAQKRPDHYIVLDACQNPVITHQKIQQVVRKKINEIIS